VRTHQLRLCCPAAWPGIPRIDEGERAVSVSVTMELIEDQTGPDNIEVRPGGLLTLADQVNARLREADDIVRKLAASGWEIARHQGLLFLEPPPDVTTGEEVEERLRSLGIDPSVVLICDTTYYEELIAEG